MKNGTEYKYVYLGGMLLFESRGEAKFYYSYDAGGTLYSVKYTLTDSSELMTYYYTHNLRGDIVGIYNGAGELRAHYEYDAWGNVISVTDQSGKAITSETHIGNLNPFRYRGYYYDSETGFYYLMSRYYDPVTHRFINADTITDGGAGVIGNNLFIYTANNPVNNSDPTGQWIIKDAIKWFAKKVVKPVVKAIQKALSKVNATYSSGVNVSGSPSSFSFNIQGGISIDTKGNVAHQGSFSGGVTSGSPGASITSYRTITNSPNIKKLEGPGYQVGGSVGISVYGAPIAAGGDFNIIPDTGLNKTYYGITTNVGFGTPGGEFHAEWGETATWEQTQFNVSDVAKGIYIKIMEL